MGHGENDLHEAIKGQQDQAYGGAQKKHPQQTLALHQGTLEVAGQCLREGVQWRQVDSKSHQHGQ